MQHVAAVIVAAILVGASLAEFSSGWACWPA